MKKLLMFLMLCVALPAAIWANQEAIIQEIPVPQFTPQPPIHFTLQDVISVIADYDVIHLNQPPSMSGWYGATDYKYNFAVYLYKGDTATKRTTLIHEIIHILYLQKGAVNTPEEQVIADETAIYAELFGAKQ